MKRQIKELRRVLLAIEADRPVFDKIADPVGAYHAYLLHDGGFVGPLIADKWIDHDNYIVGFPGLTRSGCELLDQLRDEGRLDKAQAWLESEGFDRDYLALCLAWLERDIPRGWKPVSTGIS